MYITQFHVCTFTACCCPLIGPILLFVSMNLFSIVAGYLKNHYKEAEAAYKKLKHATDQILSHSGYSEVNLSKLFQTLTVIKS